jgi:long-chain acyl-CoA synthetase
MFHFFMAVARRSGAEILDGQPVSLADRLLYALGKVFVFGPLKNVLGMSRIRVAYTAGAAIGPDLFRFYRSIGINLKQLYGQTETCAYVCLQPDGADQVRQRRQAGAGRRGEDRRQRRDPGQGPNAAQGVLQAPRCDGRGDQRRGLFHDRRRGIFDDDGHLKIIDRAKDVGKLANGAMYAPNYIENKLKFFPHIKEAVVFGDRREMVCAFINIDIGAVGNWAERRGIAYSGYTDLAAKPEVYG